jgi:hypothetical protein
LNFIFYSFNFEELILNGKQTMELREEQPIIEIENVLRGKLKHRCENCNRFFHKCRGIIIYKGKRLCYNCRQRYNKEIQSAMSIAIPTNTAQEICEKEYIVQVGSQKYSLIKLPRSMAGARVKLILLEQPFSSHLRENIIENTMNQLNQEQTNNGTKTS